MEMNKRSIKYNIDAHHHGLFIKEARLRQGYRLTEIANGICDISYLSKIESGTNIPSSKILEKLSEKLNIQFPLKENVCPITIFRKFLYQEDLSILESCLASNVLHQYEIRMINFFQSVINDELFRAFTLKKVIDQFSHHFNKKEKQIYMLFSGIFFFKNFEWEKGKRCFEKSLALSCELKEEDPYLCFELAKYYFRMQKTCLGFSYLERATIEFKKIFEKDWVFRCGILWCREAMINGDIRSAELRSGELRRIINPCKDHLQWSSFFNVLGMIYEKRGRNIQAEEYYTKSIEQRCGKIDEEFIIDIIKFYDRIQDDDQMIKLIERLDLSSLSARSRMIIDFYYFKMSDKASEHFEAFLRKDAIPFAMKGLDSQSVSLYTNELIKYHRDRLSYKKVADAYHTLEKFRRKVDLIGTL